MPKCSFPFAMLKAVPSDALCESQWPCMSLHKISPGYCKQRSMPFEKPPLGKWWPLFVHILRIEQQTKHDAWQGAYFLALALGASFTWPRVFVFYWKAPMVLPLECYELLNLNHVDSGSRKMKQVFISCHRKAANLQSAHDYGERHMAPV